MERFFNISGIPFKSGKPMLDGRIVGGTTTVITSYPYQVWQLCCCSIWRYFEIFEQKRPPVFVTTKSSESKHIKYKTDRRTRFCLCAAAEVSLTEQKKTGDSVLWFVASSTASQFHFTQAYYFELFSGKQSNYNNDLQKEKPTVFIHVPLLGG